MARVSQGPRRATTWAAEHNPRPTPRIVRLGRAANDNVRPLGRTVQMLLVIFVAAATLLAAVYLRSISSIL